jgi:hypothetical protein
VVTVARTLKMASKYEEKQEFKVSEFQGFEEQADGSEIEHHLETVKP